MPGKVAGTAAAILAGGRAQRMGGALKGLLEVGGRAIMLREVAALAQVASEVLVVAGDLDPFRAALAGAPVSWVADREPGLGPLAGLDAAFAATTAGELLVVGCDLPFLDVRLLERVRDAAPDADAVVPRVNGRPQPLHARYARRIADRVAARLARGTLALVDLLGELDVAWLDEAELRAIDPALVGFTNVNTPAELEAARLRSR